MSTVTFSNNLTSMKNSRNSRITRCSLTSHWNPMKYLSWRFRKMKVQIMCWRSSRRWSPRLHYLFRVSTKKEKSFSSTQTKTKISPKPLVSVWNTTSPILKRNSRTRMVGRSTLSHLLSCKICQGPPVKEPMSSDQNLKRVIIDMPINIQTWTKISSFNKDRALINTHYFSVMTPINNRLS
jgi:hypothetical protein